jgi:superfamily I DNA/RNA helicase
MMRAPTPAPTPTQAPLIHLPTEGQFLVRGAAGSGKSFVALERALHLARQPLLHGSPRVLLLARTPALAQAFADSLQARADGRATQVEVGAPASWCRAILGESDAPPPLDDATFARLVGEALDLVRRTSRRTLLRRTLLFFTSEIATMILALGVERFEQYGAIDREGRGSSLDEESRRTIWSVFETFRALARALGRAPAHALVPRALARLATVRNHPYDHVVVDDAHRLAPVELKLVRTLAAAGSLTLFSALEQKFDPLAATLHELGLARLDRTEALPRMLRGPAPVHAAALHVLRKKNAGDADLATIHPGTLEGAKPRLLLAQGVEQELAAAVAEIERWRRERSLRDVGVLAPRRVPLELLAAQLARAGIATRWFDDESDGAAGGDAVALGLLAHAAGREFPCVLLLDANRGSFPRAPHDLADHERAGADERARRDLHLAITRASHELAVVATEATRAPALPVKLFQVARVGEPSAEAAPAAVAADTAGDGRAAAVTS